MRACERLSPIDLYGVPLHKLNYEQALEMIAYEITRQEEELKQLKEMFHARQN